MSEHQVAVPCRQLLARKGEARPSPILVTGSPPSLSGHADAAPPPTVATMAGLSDLIRRRGASRLLDGHPLQVWEQSIPVPPTEASSGPGDRALRDRRKMTVRLPMDEFQWLDGLAKSSGRTYQSILEEATATLHRQRLYG